MESLVRLTWWWPKFSSVETSKIQLAFEVDFLVCNLWCLAMSSHGLLRAFLNKLNALMVIDSYPRWPEVYSNESLASDFTDAVIHKICSRGELSHALVTDNMEPFFYSKDKRFAEIGRRLRVNTSRKLNQAFVYTLSACTSDELHWPKDDPQMKYRDLVQPNTRSIPAKLFKNRVLRTSLP